MCDIDRPRLPSLKISPAPTTTAFDDDRQAARTAVSRRTVGRQSPFHLGKNGEDAADYCRCENPGREVLHPCPHAAIAER